jgi:hypothetical protein
MGLPSWLREAVVPMSAIWCDGFSNVSPPSTQQKVVFQKPTLERFTVKPFLNCTEIRLRAQ